MSPFIYPQNKSNHVLRMGGWSPNDSKDSVEWTREFVSKLDSRHAPVDWPKTIKDLYDLIESTAELRMLASAMFDEVPTKPPYNKDPLKHRQIRDYTHMLDCFASIITEYAPKWSKVDYTAGLIGFPFNAILDWPMATQSGYAFFLKSEVNEKFKAILNEWRDKVLMTYKSRHVITTKKNGWLCPEALEVIENDTNVPGVPSGSFQELFKCDPEGDPEHWGFASWDAFFVREFSDMNHYRPVAFKNDPKWIVSSCESKAFALQKNVKEYDTFWLKGQPYSVAEMLNHHPKASEFVGGTVYQAFLSPSTYHRWNSPVQGKVIYNGIIDGTYFSEPTIFGFHGPDHTPDPAAPDHAQGYITHVATRALIIIDAGPPVGLVACIYVGMADVSTIEIKDFQQDQTVEKGEEIGMFHHGGSTHCLIFQKNTDLVWVPEAMGSDPGAKNLPIRGKLAYVCNTE
ncbi:Phophatidylserine decarboxylase-domain-containing protein [Annulohypoxylon nitens]|nr:Phophatidylserine decarboxylase-domain-containing protein [Annulohypoxylon nitens]